MSHIHQIEFLLLSLMLLVTALAVLARKLDTPYPIVLVVGGLLLSLVPGVPHLSLNPDFVFLVFLPPLVFAAAYATSWRDFRRNLISISLLAFGLVAFTVFGVAAVTRFALPGFTWEIGLVLGAVLCTTDAIAASAIARKLGLPHRITDIIEGESLVNDASGLLALQFTVALVVSGQVPGLLSGLGTLLWLIAGGTAIGFLAGGFLSAGLTRIVDAPIEVLLTILAPYLTYLAAEAAHCSGIIAVVVCGLFLSRRSSKALGTEARLDASAVWTTVDFALNGVVFVLIGLQLPGIYHGIRSLGRERVAIGAAVVCLLVIALRMAWMFPAAKISYYLNHKLLRHPREIPDARGVFIVGWTGMRGVVALAAAFSLPTQLDNGAPFPQRELIIFLTFAVIFVTLVLQGLSLPVLIRKLGLTAPQGPSGEEYEARCLMLQAALDTLQRSGQDAQGRDLPGRKQLQGYYSRRLATIQEASRGKPGAAQAELDAYSKLDSQIREAEREVAVRLRNEDRISDNVLRKLERELDLLDLRYNLSSEE